MSLKPDYARLVLDGIKSVEFRKRFSERHAGATVLFYISRPAQQYGFTARIRAIHRLEIDRLWESFGHQGGIGRQVFDCYFTGASEGYALSLSQVRPLRLALSLDDVLSGCPQLAPPQSYKMLRPTGALADILQDHLAGEE
jgi:predicted transcriptional regulator